MNIQELETEEITRLIAELDAELQSRIQLEKEDFLDKIRDKSRPLWSIRKGFYG